MKHLWKKAGTNDDGARITRAWSCKRCAASKVRVTSKKSEAPRVTQERRVSSEKCL